MSFDQALSVRAPRPGNLATLALQILPHLLYLMSVVYMVVEDVRRQKLLITIIAREDKVIFILFDPESSHLFQSIVNIFLVKLQSRLSSEV